MSKARAKTIKLLLNDGTLNGVISMADSFWNSGKLYSAPRDSVNELLKLEICKNYGVYLLLSETMVYVGQASDLSRRIKQHIIGKSWWDKVVLLTTDNDSLDKSDIDYLEASLIDKADKVGSLDSDNKQHGNKKKVNEFRKVELEQYLEEALFLLELIGVFVFCEEKRKKKKKNTIGIGSGITSPTEAEKEIRAKSEAVRFLRDKGYSLSKHINYARYNEEKDEYWMNPRVDHLDTDWDIILNNQTESVVYLLRIPSHSLKLDDGKNKGLKVRSDKEFYIDLNISGVSFVDRKSKVSFKPYILAQIEY